MKLFLSWAARKQVAKVASWFARRFSAAVFRPQLLDTTQTNLLVRSEASYVFRSLRMLLGVVTMMIPSRL